MNWHSPYSQNTMVSFKTIDFWPEILIFRTHHVLKFHNRTDIMVESLFALFEFWCYSSWKFIIIPENLRFVYFLTNPTEGSIHDLTRSMISSELLLISTFLRIHELFPYLINIPSPSITRFPLAQFPLTQDLAYVRFSWRIPG